MTSHAATGESPFSLVYGTEAVIPVEVSLNTHRVTAFYDSQNDETRRANLDLLEEKRLQSLRHTEQAKRAAAGYFNRKVQSRQFSVGDLVLQ